jgi:predicted nuclease of predicted toxin-antitoxin system
MLFHLDEHIDSAIAEGLRRRSIDVTTTAEEGLLGVSDEQQLEFAHQSRRILVTRDVDFLRMHDRQVPHAGIVFITSTSRTVRETLRFLCLLHESLDPADMIGQVEYF